MSRNRTKFSCKKEFEHLTEDKKKEFNVRFDSVKAIIETNSSYSIRDDSRLIYRFCVGELDDLTATSVAHEIMCIQYICDTFNYTTVCEDTLKIMSNQLYAQYNLEWPEIWEILTKVGCDAIKYSCMSSNLPDFQKPKRLWSDMEEDY